MEQSSILSINNTSWEDKLVSYTKDNLCQLYRVLKSRLLDSDSYKSYKYIKALLEIMKNINSELDRRDRK